MGRRSPNLSAIKDEDVLKIAKIAGLKINHDHMKSIKSDLTAIIDFFETIESIDVSDIRGYEDPVTPFERSDVAGKSLDIKMTLRNSPEKNKNSFIVPRIIKGS